jgi:hypothetical protein
MLVYCIILYLEKRITIVAFACSNHNRLRIAFPANDIRSGPERPAYSFNSSQILLWSTFLGKMPRVDNKTYCGYPVPWEVVNLANCGIIYPSVIYREEIWPLLL